MSLRAHIQYERPGRGLFDRQAIAEAAAAGNSMAVEYWHAIFMPLHFTEQAKKRYGYQPRSGSGEPPVLRRPAGSKGYSRTYNNPKYFWRKMREKGHSIPLEYSGKGDIEAEDCNPAH